MIGRGLAALSAAALVGCTTASYPDDAIPFLCYRDQACPAHFVCSSGLCIHEGTQPLFPLVEHSGGPVQPEMHVDPDRHGVMSCWTRREDQNSPNGGIDAAFLTANTVAGTGDPPHAIRLATLDTTGGNYLASCVPVPGTGGKILIAAWTQVGGVSQMQLFVWSPSSSSMIETGSVEPYYLETGPDVTVLVPRGFHGALVGSEAWFTEQFPYPSQLSLSATPINRLARLRVGAAQLASHPYLPPIREDLITPPSAMTGLVDAEFDQRLVAADNGAWLLTGLSGNFALFWIPQVLTASLNVRTPFMIGTTDAMGLATHNGLLAFAGPGPGRFSPMESAGTATLYRVDWLATDALHGTLGPLLPFNRLDTLPPGAASVGESLYVFGAPNAGTAAQIAALLGPNDAGADAGPTDAGVVDAAGDGGALSTAAPFGMYRIPWPSTADGGVDAGADAGVAPPELVRTISRRQGDFPVTAAAAERIDDHTIGLVWVEFNRGSAVAGGASYAIYIAPIPL